MNEPVRSKSMGAVLGWSAVWLLFVVFHVLFLMNELEALLWVTLVSVGPIWVLTALGGLVEVRAVWERFRSVGGGKET